ncbi:MAG: Hsp20/alpha crystallin family protein [Deltaproteobacteria bacterium]|nr:Hsp20/alpha crystallin family protein [Deltaproteobacteria bacterium]
MLGHLSETIDRCLNRSDFFDEINRFFESSSLKGETPAINLYQEDDNTVAVVELPGFKKDDINVEVKGTQFRVYGKRELNYPDQSSARLLERNAVKFDRTIKLNNEVDHEKITAEYKDGILKVVLPTKESEKAKQILIS